VKRNPVTSFLLTCAVCIIVPVTAKAQAPYKVGQTVEVDVGGKWVVASIVNIKDGRYALSRHDKRGGVTTDNEWVDAARLRAYVAPARVAPPPAAALPSTVPTGDYVCVTYGSTSMTVGKLRIYSNGKSSGITTDGSGPQYPFSYDKANGELKWPGGLRILSWTVEAAEYRPQTNGKPSINLHYRRGPGANLLSMGCTHQ
jgi:hypothetical protein